jgi:hypothetical protein
MGSSAERGQDPHFEELIEMLNKSKAVYEMIDGHPTTREEFATAAPVRS